MKGYDIDIEKIKLIQKKVLPFEDKILLETILKTVPSKFRSINEKAFQGGIFDSFVQ